MRQSGRSSYIRCHEPRAASVLVALALKINHDRPARRAPAGAKGKNDVRKSPLARRHCAQSIATPCPARCTNADRHRAGLEAG